MDILISENQVKKIIKEDLGVARDTIPYTNVIYGILEPIVKKFAEEKIDEEHDLIIRGNDLKPVYTNNFEEFIEFPINDIKLVLKLNYINNENQYDSGFETGGAAYTIRKKKKQGSYITKLGLWHPKKVLEEVTEGVSARMDIQVSLYKDFDNDNIENLLYDLRDTIFHELNHLYESYKRKMAGAPKIDTALSYAGEGIKSIPTEINNLWVIFLYYVYYSEPYEINAMSQEVYSKRLRMSFDELKNTRYYEIANEMRKFNADEFYNLILSKYEIYGDKKVDKIIDKLYKKFMNSYLKSTKNPLRLVTSSKNLQELLMNFEKRINDAGKKLIKNFARTYVISPE